MSIVFDRKVAHPYICRMELPYTMNEAEVALLLAVSRSTVANWRSRGQGPPYTRVGGSIRYDRAEVLAWLAAGHVDPSEGGG